MARVVVSTAAALVVIGGQHSIDEKAGWTAYPT
jgi:hypothetical protein